MNGKADKTYKLGVVLKEVPRGRILALATDCPFRNVRIS